MPAEEKATCPSLVTRAWCAPRLIQPQWRDCCMSPCRLLSPRSGFRCCCAAPPPPAQPRQEARGGLAEPGARAAAERRASAPGPRPPAPASAARAPRSPAGSAGAAPRRSPAGAGRGGKPEPAPAPRIPSPARWYLPARASNLVTRSYGHGRRGPLLAPLRAAGAPAGRCGKRPRAGARRGDRQGRTEGWIRSDLNPGSWRGCRLQMRRTVFEPGGLTGRKTFGEKRLPRVTDVHGLGIP
ncbi:translation initiation factor IF-2-like [Nycticebus coucang]|uniref:translation initiation factor IF-2-like n=1 Tax=Nycticebus coucang TaxID=9470 RepID=UPI00234C2FE2|nr:translation initiation factor IF-2-like [Nycticebus coucang]